MVSGAETSDNEEARLLKNSKNADQQKSGSSSAGSGSEEEAEEFAPCGEFTPEMSAVVFLQMEYKDAPMLVGIYWVMMVLTIAYVSANIVLNKGYQLQDPLVGVASSRILGYVKATGNSSLVHDARDLVFPPKEPGAVFITTEYKAVAQTRGTCADNIPCDPCTAGQKCQLCQNGRTTHGFTTGYCLQHTQGTRRCEIAGWCPTLQGALDLGMVSSTVLHGLENMNVTLSVYATFPTFNRTVNFKQWVTLGQVFSKAGVNVSDIPAITSKGLVMELGIRLACNLDLLKETATSEETARICPADLIVQLLTDHDEDTLVAKSGYSFEHVDYTGSFSGKQREFTRSTGIRMLMRVDGYGFGFSTSALFNNIGAGLGLLVAVAFITDTLAQMIVYNSNTDPEDKTYRTLFSLREHSLPGEEYRAWHEEKKYGIECDDELFGIAVPHDLGEEEEEEGEGEGEGEEKDLEQQPEEKEAQAGEEEEEEDIEAAAIAAVVIAEDEPEPTATPVPVAAEADTEAEVVAEVVAEAVAGAEQ